MTTRRIGLTGRPPGVSTSTNRTKCPDCSGTGKFTVKSTGTVMKCQRCGGDGGLYGNPPKRKEP